MKNLLILLIITDCLLISCTNPSSNTSDFDERFLGSWKIEVVHEVVGTLDTVTNHLSFYPDSFYYKGSGWGVCANKPEFPERVVCVDGAFVSFGGKWETEGDSLFWFVGHPNINNSGYHFKFLADSVLVLDQADTYRRISSLFSTHNQSTTIPN